MKKYLWNILGRYVPLWIAPNVLTLAGNISSWLSFVFLFFFFSPFFGTTAQTTTQNFHLSSFFLLVPAVGIFIYYTLDNIDGSHAVRTQSSSPLGEFFDHWLDGFNIFLLPVGFGYVAGMPYRYLLLVVIAGVLPFWATFWEQQKTGIIVMGKISQAEGIFLVILLYVLSAIFGTAFFHQRIFLFTIIEYLALITSMGYLVITFNILRHHKEEWLQVMGLLASLVFPLGAYALFQQKNILSEYHLFIFLLLLGFIGWKHIGDVQRAHLIGTAYQPYDFSFIFLGLALLGSVWINFPQEGIFYSFSLVSLIAIFFLCWVFVKLAYQYVHTTRYITKSLGIKIFSLKSKEQKSPPFMGGDECCD